MNSNVVGRSQVLGDLNKEIRDAAKATDRVVPENPDQAVAVGVGVGALIGHLIGRKHSANRD